MEKRERGFSVGMGSLRNSKYIFSNSEAEKTKKANEAILNVAIEEVPNMTVTSLKISREKASEKVTHNIESVFWLVIYAAVATVAFCMFYVMKEEFLSKITPLSIIADVMLGGVALLILSTIVMGINELFQNVGHAISLKGIYTKELAKRRGR